MALKSTPQETLITMFQEGESVNINITIEQYLALSALAYNTTFKRIAREFYNYAINSHVAKK